jgi:tetratricopeptide (TPR) repeat protein
LGLVERRGTAEHAIQVIEMTGAWLAAPGHSDDTIVRSAYLGLVEACGTCDRREETIRLMKSWLTKHSYEKGVCAALLGCLFRLCRIEEALEIACAAIEHNPDDQNSLTHYLRAVQANGDDEMARELCERLLRVSPRNFRVQAHYAAWLRDRHHLDDAERYYRNLLKHTPAFIQGNYGYGKLLLMSNRHDEAATRFRNVLRIRPRHAMARNGLACALWKLGYFEDAEREFRSAIDCAIVQEDATGKLFADLGWFLLDRERWHEALSAFKSACDEDTDNFANYWGMGRALMGLGDFAVAADVLRTALQKEPTLQPPASLEIPRLLEECLSCLPKGTMAAP